MNMRHVIIPGSSQVYSVGYDGETRRAQVCFFRQGAPGDTYEYEHVSPQQVLDLIFAESVGSHMARVFKVQHTLYTKLTPVTQTAEAL